LQYENKRAWEAVDAQNAAAQELCQELRTLREQLAHALRCPDPICETCRNLKRDLADLPNAPEKEKP